MKSWELERDRLIEDTLVFVRSVAPPRPIEDGSQNAEAKATTEAVNDVRQSASDEQLLATTSDATSGASMAAASSEDAASSEATQPTNPPRQVVASNIETQPAADSSQAAPLPAAKPILGTHQQVAPREHPRAKVFGAERDSATVRSVTPYARVRRDDAGTAPAIEDRVAAFREHQTKLSREREAYFNSVQTRIKSQLSQQG